MRAIASWPAIAGRAATALALVTVGPAVGTAESQTAEEIVDRYIVAIGGYEAIESVSTVRYVRTVFNTEDGATSQQSRRVIYTKRPYFYRAEDPESGRIYISDGRHAWTGRVSDDSDSISWQEASVMLRSRDLDSDKLFGSFIDFARKGYQAEFRGHHEQDGVELQVVRVKWLEGDHWDFYFDPSTALCYGYNSNPDGGSGLTRVDDYRRVGAILVPHRNSSIDRLDTGGHRLHERRYHDIEVNVPLADSLFSRQSR